MKIHLTYADIPELAGLDPGEQREVVQACWWKGLTHWQCWGALLAFLACTSAGVVAGVVAQYQLGLPAAAHYACNAAGMLIGWLVYFNVWLRQLRPHFGKYIAEGRRRDRPRLAPGR